MIRTPLLCLAGLSLCCIPALATQPADTGQQTLIMEGFAPNSRDGFTIRQIRLHYSPASLSGPAEQAHMHHRIETAAHVVCHYNGMHISTRVREQIHNCEEKSVSEALEKLSLPR